jgi:hypothetical protein
MMLHFNVSDFEEIHDVGKAWSPPSLQVSEDGNKIYFWMLMHRRQKFRTCAARRSKSARSDLVWGQ